MTEQLIRMASEAPPSDQAMVGCMATCQFARVAKGVDLRSTAGNCAWARTPQLTLAMRVHDSAHEVPMIGQAEAARARQANVFVLT